MDSSSKPNRLVKEKSPYLLQHAYNPVDWYTWSIEAFKKAKEEDKPIFLSIGYSTCHWCHVMERESFENHETAKLLNKYFIPIKVDREERPDIDNIYMNVCQALTGSGGWPLNIFMTNDQKPFYAGTYFPKEGRYGMLGFDDLIKTLGENWVNNKEKLLENSENITNVISKRSKEREKENLSEDIVKDAISHFKMSFDEKYGGFGNAPKFPTPHNLSFLIRNYVLTKDETLLNIVENTLQSMYKGGIYDHIGFGFSRYSTDKLWLVPHFEKMLYDNALLAITYIEAYQVTKKKIYKEVVDGIFTYIHRDMTNEDGGFYSAEDADSEGVEGKFYVWSKDEILEVLGDDVGNEFCNTFDITSRGNFEGSNIPNLIKFNSDIFEEDYEAIYEETRRKLFEVRDKRIHPHKDDKILTSWNGLMIAALAYGGRVFNNNDYIEAAENAVRFIQKNLIRDDGRLLARYRDNESAYLAYVDDYAFLIWGLIELYQATFEIEYLEKAISLNEQLIQYFWDDIDGGLFLYGKDSENLIIRPKDVYDGATPSGNSIAVINWIRLARLTGNEDLIEKANISFATFSNEIKAYPSGYSAMLIGFLMYINPTQEIVLVGEKTNRETDEFINTMNQEFLPFSVAILANEQINNKLSKIVSYIEGYKMIDNKTTAYVCENFTCNAPTSDIQEFQNQI